MINPLSCLRLYVVNDVLSGEFFPPFTSKNDETAIRTFRISLKDNPNPEDYNLFYVGDFDSGDGSVVSACASLVAKGGDLCNSKK